MAPKSTAERCKKYHQKHKEVYRERAALRKRNYRQKMKANPIANEKRLRVKSQRKYSYCHCQHNKTMTLLFRKPT